MSGEYRTQSSGCIQWNVGALRFAVPELRSRGGLAQDDVPRRRQSLHVRDAQSLLILIV